MDTMTIPDIIVLLHSNKYAGAQSCFQSGFSSFKVLTRIKKRDTCIDDIQICLPVSLAACFLHLALRNRLHSER